MSVALLGLDDRWVKDTHIADEGTHILPCRLRALDVAGMLRLSEYVFFLFRYLSLMLDVTLVPLALWDVPYEVCAAQSEAARTH